MAEKKKKPTAPNPKSVEPEAIIASETSVDPAPAPIALAPEPSAPLEPWAAKIVEMLDHKRGDRRTAAAIMLGELLVSGPEVIAGLRKAVRRFDDPSLRRHACEAIGAIGSKSIVQDLRPLLKDPEPEVRDAAKRVLSSGKGVTLDDIKEMLSSREDRQRISAIAVLGALTGPATRQLLFTQLEDESAKVVDAAKDALRPLLSEAGGLDAMESLEELEALAQEGRLAKSQTFAMAVIELLGHLSSEGAADVLTKIGSMPSVSLEVRAFALQTVRRVIQGKKPTQKVFRFLLEILEAGTPQQLLGAAADALTGVEVPLALEPRVRALTGSDHAAARRWSLRALGTLDSAPAAKALAKAVESGDATDREVALEAALLTANGKVALAKLLTTVTDEDKARFVANALKKNASTLLPAALHTLESAVLEVPPAISPIILDLLKSVGGGGGKAQDSLFESAMRAKKKASYYDAAELFKRLSQGNINDAEARFQQGICELKLSRRIVSRGGKSNDPCVLTFHSLIRVRDFPVIDRLKKEGLSADELYYLGFSLAEHSEAAQGMGGDILTIVDETSDDPKLKQMAHNKLVTMGFTE
jgi:HEAT repeat protein